MERLATARPEITRLRSRKSGTPIPEPILHVISRLEPLVRYGSVRAGQLAEAMPGIRREIAGAANVLIESNSVLRFLRPELYLAVLDTSIADFKPTALRYLDRANAVLLSARQGSAPAWPGVSPRIIAGIPAFETPGPTYWSAEAEQFVRIHLANLSAQARALES